MQQTMKKNKKAGKQTDMRNMDSHTVAQMMQRMNPQMLQHLGGINGLDAMMREMEKVRRGPAPRPAAACRARIAAAEMEKVRRSLPCATDVPSRPHCARANPPMRRRRRD
jgi:hypothetical protein